jgi:hypothetical protein
MAGHTRKMEGDENERRRAASKARSQGKAPSEVGATLGASKQLRQAKKDASHQEKLETRNMVKRNAGTSGKPRPGNRDTDPKRTERWE